MTQPAFKPMKSRVFELAENLQIFVDMLNGLGYCYCVTKKQKDKNMNEKTIKLSKAEIELIKHSLYVHREMVRAQERLALNDSKNPAAKRDADRFGKILRFSLELDGKL